MTFSNSTACLWPVPRVGEALSAVVKHSKLGSVEDGMTYAPPAEKLGAIGELHNWLSQLTETFGAELDEVSFSLPQLARVQRTLVPAVWRIRHPAGEPSYLAVLRARGSAVDILRPDGVIQPCSQAALREIVMACSVPATGKNVETLLRRAGASGAKLERLERKISAQYASDLAMVALIVRRPPRGNLAESLVASRCLQFLLWLLGVHAAGYGASVAGWGFLGRAVLGGRSLDLRWASAWLLASLTVVSLRTAEGVLRARLGRVASTVLRRHLLLGALRLDYSAIRAEGIGSILGRVSDSEQLQNVAISGGIVTLVSVVELVVLAVVASYGIAGGWHVTLLLMWCAIAVAMALQLRGRRQSWVAERLKLSRQLLERMMAHRTRLAQQSESRWFAGEDDELTRYHGISKRMDDVDVLPRTLLARGWVVASCILLGTWMFTHLSPMEGSALAISVAVVFLGSQTFSTLAAGLSALMDASLLWQTVEPVLRLAPNRRATGRRSSGLRAFRNPKLEVRNVRFRHAGSTDDTIQECSFDVAPNDRILIEGESGSGKSTLGALLSALRTPSSGLLLFAGYDVATLGEQGWRDHVTCVPQFHENHIVSGPFALNLLMGRSWPSTKQSWADAIAVCDELGLGDLLRRMPGGLMQHVGETGWQLSHGERSRVFLARAILQNSDVVVFDECFAALDPETLQQALSCVFRRTRACIVIAHP